MLDEITDILRRALTLVWFVISYLIMPWLAPISAYHDARQGHYWLFSFDIFVMLGVYISIAHFIWSANHETS